MTGHLAGAVDEFEARPGQRDMAQAVADSFERGVDLLAEAGTGTGKTLAYLVPAILCGHRVLISTGTKNLQEQIYFKDIPILRRALDVPFSATYHEGPVELPVPAPLRGCDRAAPERRRSTVASFALIAAWANRDRDR